MESYNRVLALAAAIAKLPEPQRTQNQLVLIDCLWQNIPLTGASSECNLFSMGEFKALESALVQNEVNTP